MAIRGSTAHLDREKDLELGWSALVEANGFLFLAGIAAIEDTPEGSVLVGAGDPEVQINRIYDQIEQVLALKGATLEHVVKEVIYVTEDIATLMPAFEARKRRYVSFELPVTAGCRVAALDTPGAMVEIMVTAVCPGK